MSTEQPKVDGRKTSWTPARRKAFSEYVKAHPRGFADPAWWKAHPEMRERMAAQQRERMRMKRLEAEGG